jgi:adenosylmethionine-8-amino-7-oxononanoate aminotransferase
MTSPLHELDRRHLWHPYTQHCDAPPPVIVTRGDGAYLYDDRGRRIFDAISSWWVTLHGHAHPAIAAAIARQAGTLDGAPAACPARLTPALWVEDSPSTSC